MTIDHFKEADIPPNLILEAFNDVCAQLAERDALRKDIRVATEQIKTLEVKLAKLNYDLGDFTVDDQKMSTISSKIMNKKEEAE